MVAARASSASHERLTSCSPAGSSWPRRPSSLGLVNRVLAPGGAVALHRGYAERLATEIAPSSLAVTKLQLYRDLHGDVASSVRDASARMADMMRGADFAEGVAALTEKRAARLPLDPPA